MDLEVAAVDAVVVEDDHLGELDVLVLEGLQDAVELLAHDVQAAQRGLLEAVELVAEVLAGAVLRHPLSRTSR